MIFTLSALYLEPSGYALGLQIAPRVKIIHFTPSGHNILFYNRQKNVTFMHRYQVAKYVIFDSEKIFVKKFPWVLK
jgi:hypothetical protein